MVLGPGLLGLQDRTAPHVATFRWNLWGNGVSILILGSSWRGGKAAGAPVLRGSLPPHPAWEEQGDGLGGGIKSCSVRTSTPPGTKCRNQGNEQVTRPREAELCSNGSPRASYLFYSEGLPTQVSPKALSPTPTSSLTWTSADKQDVTHRRSSCPLPPQPSLTRSM